MFKKKLLAILSAALVATMVPATALAAEWNTNGGTSTVEGTAYAVEPIIEVQLPGDLEFGINPLYLDADGDTTTTNDRTQIVTGQYMIANYSNVDVLVTAQTSATAAQGSNVAFLQDNDTDSITGELLSTDAKKNVYLVQMLPKNSATYDSTNEVYNLAMNPFTLVSGSADEIGGLVLGSDTQKALFKLAAYNESVTNQVNHVSGFTFAGAVDPNASFTAGDVTVKTVFTLNTLTANQSTNAYETYVVNGITCDATVVQTVSGN